MRVLTALAAALLLTSHTAWATPFTATYTFTGSPGNQASEPVDANPVGAVFGDIVRGAGITPNAGANSINSAGWSLGTLDPLDYYAFTITPDASYRLDVDQIAFTERRSQTGILTFEVRSSLDGFTSTLYSAATPDNEGERRHTFGLVGFDDLTAPVEFRIFGYAAEGNTGTWRLGVSGSSAFPANLQVGGDLAVPEPGTLMLLGAGALGAIARARRRQTARP